MIFFSISYFLVLVPKLPLLFLVVLIVLKSSPSIIISLRSGPPSIKPIVPSFPFASPPPGANLVFRQVHKSRLSVLHGFLLIKMEKYFCIPHLLHVLLMWQNAKLDLMSFQKMNSMLLSFLVASLVLVRSSLFGPRGKTIRCR